MRKEISPHCFLRSAKCKRIHYTACFVFSKQAVFLLEECFSTCSFFFSSFWMRCAALDKSRSRIPGPPAFKVENGRTRTPTASYISRETVIRFLNLFTRITVFSIKINTFHKKEKTK